MELKTFKTEDVKNKKILIRVDYNVPVQNGKVTDDARIRAHASTIEKLLNAGARVALVSHFGRPKGKPVPEMSLAPIVEDVARAYGKKVHFVNECVGPAVEDAIKQLPCGDLLLLENVRFHPEEQENDPAFAALLAQPFDAFVMDAFSASHRADASTNGIMSVLPSYAGDVLIKEGKMLGAVSDNPISPYVLILGGAKVSDKIDVVNNLLNKANTILIGGGMAYTFLKAKGYSIGKSLCEEERISFAAEVLKKATAQGVEILLPVDSIMAKGLDSTETLLANSDSMPDGLMGLDIGPQTIELFSRALEGAKSVLWNGPMGVFENSLFANGTIAVAKAVAHCTQEGCTTVIGGGDTAAAIRQFGFEKDVSYVSTGGGASLEYCEGKKLPGMAPLEIKTC